MAHWSEKYIGLPYEEGKMDCAELVKRVLFVEFGKVANIPSERAAGLRGKSQQIDLTKDKVAKKVKAPREGDVVLMRCRGALGHVGVYCLINHEAWVLHALKNAGQVCIHRMHNLHKYGLEVEGFYRCR